MSKTKVVLRYPTKGAKANETIEVDADVAEALIANGNAKAVKPGPKAEPDKG